MEVRRGPPLDMKEHVLRSKKEHRQTFEKQGHIWAEKTVDPYRLLDVVEIT